MPRRRISVAPLDEISVLRAEIEELRRIVMTMKQPGPTTLHVDDHTAAVDPIQGQLGISYPGRHGRANHTSGLFFYHKDRMQNINTGANFVIKVFADDETTEVGDGKFIWAVPEDVDTLQLYYTEAFVTTAGGLVQVDLFNITQGLAMLSTKIEIDAGQFHSHASSPLPVINLANSQVDFMDRIRIDVDAGGGTMGLGVVMVFL